MENKDIKKEDTTKKLEKMQYDILDETKCKLIAKKILEYIKNSKSQ